MKCAQSVDVLPLCLFPFFLFDHRLLVLPLVSVSDRQRLPLLHWSCFCQMKDLLDRLHAYNSTVVPPIFTWGPGDPQADPKKHGGAWTPWINK